MRTAFLKVAVAAVIRNDDLLGLGLLLLDPGQRICRLKRLRRLGLGSLSHADHHDAVGVDIHRQLELVIRGLR